MRHIFIILALVVISLVSCSFDYEEGRIAESLDKNLPDIILENAKLVFVRGTKVTVEADRIEIYSEQKQQNMFNITFKEVSDNDHIRMLGRADQISVEPENNNVTMVGEIQARSNKDEAELLTEYLYWNDGDKIIQGSEIYPVNIKKDIGSAISGYGFYGNAQKREITLNGSVKGRLVVEEENNE